MRKIIIMLLLLSLNLIADSKCSKQRLDPRSSLLELGEVSRKVVSSYETEMEILEEALEKAFQVSGVKVRATLDDPEYCYDPESTDTSVQSYPSAFANSKVPGMDFTNSPDNHQDWQARFCHQFFDRLDEFYNSEEKAAVLRFYVLHEFSHFFLASSWREQDIQLSRTEGILNGNFEHLNTDAVGLKLMKKFLYPFNKAIEHNLKNSDEFFGHEVKDELQENGLDLEIWNQIGEQRAAQARISYAEGFESWSNYYYVPVDCDELEKFKDIKGSERLAQIVEGYGCATNDLKVFKTEFNKFEKELREY